MERPRFPFKSAVCCGCLRNCRRPGDERMLYFGRWEMGIGFPDGHGKEMGREGGYSPFLPVLFRGMSRDILRRLP